MHYVVLGVRGEREVYDRSNSVSKSIFGYFNPITERDRTTIDKANRKFLIVMIVGEG